MEHQYCFVFQTPKRVGLDIKSPDRIEEGGTYIISRKRETPRGKESDFATPSHERRPSLVVGRRGIKRIRSPGLEDREPMIKIAKAAKSDGRESLPSTPVVSKVLSSD